MPPKTNTRSLDTLLKYFFLILFFFVCLYLLYTRTLSSINLQSTNMAWSRWAFSDWLINYAGGYVRRGLVGEILRLHANGEPMLIMVNRVVFIIGLLNLALMSLLVVIKKELSFWPTVGLAILPGSFFYSLATNTYFYRKESFFYIPILVAALAAALVLQKSSSRIVRLIFVVSWFIACCLGAIAIQLHEAFLCMGAPMLLILGYYGFSIFSPRSPLRTFWWVSTLPIIISFLMVCAHHGTPAIEEAIWSSLTPMDQQRISLGLYTTFEFNSGELVDRSRRAISVLSSNAKLEFSWVFERVFLTHALAVWMLILFALLSIFTLWWRSLSSKEHSRADAERFKVLCVVGLFFAMPVWLFSEDWGRWIIAPLNMALIASIATLNTNVKFPAILKRLELCTEKINISDKAFSIPLIIGIIAIATLLLAVPECCLAQYPQKNILGALLNLIL